MPDSDDQLARTLDNEQREAALKVLNYVRNEITVLSKGDVDLAFRIRRFIHARLQLDNRPSRALQRLKFDEQQGRCAECNQPFEQKGTHLHRLRPEGYTADNTILLHPVCHTALHRRLGTPPE
jgi:hypothetical protein